MLLDIHHSCDKALHLNVWSYVPFVDKFEYKKDIQSSE